MEEGRDGVREDAVIRANTSSDVVRLKVTLLDVAPPIWRRFQVPARFTLHRLHSVLQDVMGWQDSHLHLFRVGEAVYGPPSDLDFEDLLDSRRATLSALTAGGTPRMRYEYDFGDGWDHLIEIEEAVAGTKSNQKPLCLAGERSCPPEDCGGPPGYADILAALKNPKRRGARDILEWLPPGFDPELFDVEEVNASLRSLR